MLYVSSCYSDIWKIVEELHLDQVFTTAASEGSGIPKCVLGLSDKMRQDATSIDTATGITGCRLNFESSLLVVRRLHKFLEIMSEGSCYEFHRQQSQTPKPSFVKMFQRIREVAA